MNLSGAPPARCGASGVWTGSRFIVWGGMEASGAVGTGFSYNPAANQWSPISNTQAPSPRSWHTGIWTGSRMLIWGGGTSSGGLYDPATNSWQPTSLVNARKDFVAPDESAKVWTGRELLIWGGNLLGSYTN